MAVLKNRNHWLIVTPACKTRCPPFVGEQHFWRCERRLGTPLFWKLSESALVLRQTLGVVRCGFRESQSISRPSPITIPVRQGFREHINGRFTGLREGARLPSWAGKVAAGGWHGRGRLSTGVSGLSHNRHWAGNAGPGSFQLHRLSIGEPAAHPEGRRDTCF